MDDAAEHEDQHGGEDDGQPERAKRHHGWPPVDGIGEALQLRAPEAPPRHEFNRLPQDAPAGASTRTRQTGAVTRARSSPPAKRHATGSGAGAGTRCAGIADHRERGPVACRGAAPDRRELCRPERIRNGLAPGHRIVEIVHQPHGAAVADPPLGRHDGSGAGLEQRRRQPLQSLARDDDTSCRAAGRQHHQVRVQPERGQVGRREKAVLPLAPARAPARSGRASPRPPARAWRSEARRTPRAAGA